VIDESKETEAVVEKLIEDRPSSRIKRKKTDGEIVNVLEEKAKKRIQKELGGGYAETDEKHAGVVSSKKKGRRDKKPKNVLQFLESADNTTGSW
jgi:Spy/CpxP family protein refolding chaperone